MSPAFARAASIEALQADKDTVWVILRLHQLASETRTAANPTCPSKHNVHSSLTLGQLAEQGGLY